MPNRQNLTTIRIPEPVSHHVTYDAHNSQAHSQQRTLTQHDMPPHHPVNINEFYGCFEVTLARNNVAP